MCGEWMVAPFNLGFIKITYFILNMDVAGINKKLELVLKELCELKSSVTNIDKKYDEFTITMEAISKEQIKLKESFRFLFREVETAKKSVGNIMNENTDLKESISFMSSKFDDYKVIVDDLVNDNKKLHTADGGLEIRVKECERELGIMMRKTEVFARTELSSNIELSNIYKEEGVENLTEVTNKLIKKCGINLSTKGIVGVYRKKDSLKGNPGNVILKLGNVEDRDLVLQGLRKVKVLNTDLGLKGDRQIYGREMLTKEGEDIFYKALNFKKVNGWRFLWIKQGKVFIRKVEGDKCHWLRDIKELNNLV